MNRFKIAIGRESDFEAIWEIGKLILMMCRGFKNSTYYVAILMKILPCIVHIAPGVLKKVLKIGKTQMPLEKPIVVAEIIKVSI